MKNTFSNSFSVTALTVPQWMKLFIGTICFLPIALMFWVIFRQVNSPNGDFLVVVFFAIFVASATGWLALRLYSLCTIRISRSEISQTFFLFRGVLIHKCVMPWEAIQSVSFSRSSYRFVAKTGEIFELNTSLFSDSEVAIASVRDLMPETLLSKLK